MQYSVTGDLNVLLRVCHPRQVSLDLLRCSGHFTRRVSASETENNVKDLPSCKPGAEGNTEGKLGVGCWPVTAIVVDVGGCGGRTMSARGKGASTCHCHSRVAYGNNASRHDGAGSSQSPAI